MAVTQELVDNIKKQLEGLNLEEQQKKLDEIMSKLPPEDREQLMGGGDCPFCSMVKGNIPVRKVYEDDKVLAILDINPANKGHTLLFPKNHAQFLAQMEDDDVAHLFKVANRLSDAIFQAIGAQGTNILLSNGNVAGQKSPHVIVNLIPRMEGDGVGLSWNPKKLDDSVMDEVATKISDKAKGISINKEEIVVIKQEAPVVKKDGFLDDMRIP